MKYKIIILCILLVLFSSGCASKTTPISKTGFYFNTVITITLYDSAQAPLLDQCFLLAEKYEGLFSKTVEGSDVYRLNHSNGAPVKVSEETIALLQKALDYAELSHGAVDPTVGSLSSLWDFSEKSDSSIPSSAALLEAITHINYQNVSINTDNQTVTLTDPLAQIDFGFIAKGYIADRFKEYLVANGVTSAMINLGGNVVVIGSKPDGSAYTVGIQDPFAPVGTAAYTLPLTDCSAVSSGNYERYFIKDDVLYHHILDTDTGYPVDNDLMAVTIISPDSVDGDALSTLCFVLGLEKGRQLIESLPDVSAIFITKDGQQHYTSQ